MSCAPFAESRLSGIWQIEPSDALSSPMLILLLLLLRLNRNRKARMKNSRSCSAMLSCKVHFHIRALLPYHTHLLFVISGARRADWAPFQDVGLGVALSLGELNRDLYQTMVRNFECSFFYSSLSRVAFLFVFRFALLSSMRA